MKQFRPATLLLILSSLCGGTVVIGQTTESTDISRTASWLPQRHYESLGPYLERIVTHAESRRLCPQLLEARLAEGQLGSNPKFIVTCKLDNAQSINLIYTQQDVLEEFRNIAYEHKDVLEPEPAQLLLDSLEPDRIDTAKTVCKQQVKTEARDGDLAILPDNDAIDIRPRQDGKLAVFVKYHIGQRAPVLNFTAICVVDENNLAAMEVYPD